MDSKILYHRGNLTAPENSLPAFEMVHNGEANGVELDVQFTRDGIPVVIHDLSVDRTTSGSGMVKDLTLKELQEFKIISEEFPDQSVPTLRRVLEVLAGVEVINLELKLFSKNISDNNSWVRELLKIVKEMNLLDDIIFSSYNHYCIKQITELDPAARTGVIYRAALYEPWEYAKNLGADAIHPYYMSITPELVQKAHEHGLKVVCYGTDEIEDIKKLMCLNVDMIITEAVDSALAARQNMGAGDCLK